MGQDNRFKAFIEPDLSVLPLRAGPLSGISFGVKDVIAVAGHSSSAGNPDWLRTHAPAAEHAACINRLLHAGAALKGMTHTDELMYSLGGENMHYGTPINPRGAGQIPGGSSSGSAVAVASGSVDFAIGTDTGGSVRVPASYCGVYGFRPSHGAVGLNGIIPLAPRFDTVGWMAGDPGLMYRIGQVLLEDSTADSERELSSSRPPELMIAKDAWALTDPVFTDFWSTALQMLQAGASGSEEIVLAKEGLKAWAEVFRVLQGREIWQVHGEWISAESPAFAPDIAARFTMAEQLSKQDLSWAEELQVTIARQVRELLGEKGFLVIPTVPAAAPGKGGNPAELERNRNGALSLCCIAGLTGLPQVTLPVEVPGGLPLGISVIAGAGQDRRLLRWITSIWKAV